MLCSPQLQLSMTASHISRQGHARLIACRHTAQTCQHTSPHAGRQDTMQQETPQHTLPTHVLAISGQAHRLQAHSADWSTHISWLLSGHDVAGGSPTHSDHTF